MAHARKPAAPVWALGMMSGTSLDGVDAAMVLTDGVEVLEFGPAAFRPYTDAEREVLRAALGRWPGEDGVAEAAAVVDAAHAEVAAGFEGVELIGFHGQTLAHDPRARGTHQAGDGDALAAATGCAVVWDFRSADVAFGGEGAPLAPFYHHALARRMGAGAPVGFVNIGGVANITWADPRIADPAARGAIVAFDTGPGNALMDDLLRARGGPAFDADGERAARGTPDERIVARALADPFFARTPPKSLDRDHWAGLAAEVHAMDEDDALATLAAVTVLGIEAGVGLCPSRPSRLLLCGGGRKNAHILNALQAILEIEVESVEAADLDGDMLEAQAFAFLAVRAARGMPTSAPGTTGVRAPVSGGRISRPG